MLASSCTPCEAQQSFARQELLQQGIVGPSFDVIQSLHRACSTVTASFEAEFLLVEC